ncbi:hypothetical protein EW145_g3625 [Phellinidium pouzarii]|uniref:SnoaL-like domain-containing protein n=1 Tax=Phellinidium pouzarii TaxID=167371 RepID=A0A4S4L8D9_9AGAM|nr:hypothetical protein EW145_g3625 [Phellinidium pouzarii]
MSPFICREDLLAAARSFCDAFAKHKLLDEILAYFATDNAACLEHGLPQLAPFLGRRFTGPDGVREYFRLIADLLSYEDMRFSDYVVDADSLKVSVKGQAKFTWNKTANSWQEVFAYMLEFDEQRKVKLYEVWADSGAAYMASRGELSSK